MRGLRLLFAAAIAALPLVACSSNPPVGAGDGSTSATATSSATATAIHPAATVTAVPGPAGHDGARSMDHLNHLASTIGPRVPTTPASAEAIAYISEQFAASGYNVARETFPIEAPSFRPASVRIPGQGVIDAFAMTGSGPGPASGTAVFVGSATAAEVAATDVDGAIAVATRDDITFADKAAAVAEAGAAGLIIVNHGDGVFAGQLGDTSVAIPVIAVGGDASSSLASAAEAATHLTIRIEGPGEAVGTNVVARAGERCDVLAGGHFDSVFESPGANDNGSGTAQLLELARAFAADGLDEGLCFAAFDAEELGLLGSSALVMEWSRNGPLPRFMVNLDVTGQGDSIELIGDDDLVDGAGRIASILDIEAEPATLRPGTGSDHQSFQAAGVPVLYISTGMFEDIHTSADAVASVDPSAIERTGDLAYATIAELLNEIAAGGDGQ